ncbi:hypothetical protein Agub_g1856 [Astrephomene gubernaculifera]|uniref:Uncharacterized protein n=1 Tax=Astrephomene gubernaculifera TaxID=47775 RepID=A0AAD3DIT9_9CHLO|nr:hypothetical protein Agub_g1856 [Astrephomene gubernaculifera]
MESCKVAAPRQRQRNFPDVLRELSIPAMDFFVQQLGKLSIRAMRETCRQFRDAIDSSVRQITIRVNWEYEASWTAGRLPSVARWPRCNTVCMVSQLNQPNVLDSAGSFTLPFTKMSLNARRQITSLTLSGYDRMPGAETVVALLASRLPGLRELDLEDLYGVSDERLHLRTMYCSLACLPHLERLALPSGAALACLDALSGSPLKYLHVCSHRSRGLPQKQKVDASELRGLLLLRELRELTLSDCHLQDNGNAANCSPPQLLLRSLPASLESLRLKRCGIPRRENGKIDLLVHLKARRIVSVDLAPTSGVGYDAVSLEQLAVEMSQGLLAGLLAGPQQPLPMQVLRIGQLQLSGSRVRVLDEARLGDLKRALQRCFTRVEVGAVWVDSKTPAAAVLQGLEVLGAPEHLDVGLPQHSGFLSDRIRVAVAAPLGGQPLLAGAAAQHPPAKASLPSADEVVRAAVERLAAAGTLVTAVGEGASDCAVGGAGARPAGHVRLVDGKLALLLRGSLMALVTQDLNVFIGWVQLLQKHVSGATGSHDHYIGTQFQGLPGAAAAILACGHEVVTEVAQAAGTLASAAEGALSLQVVMLRPPGNMTGMSPSGLPAELFTQALQEVVQEAWNAAAEADEGISVGRRRLEWLLEISGKVDLGSWCLL